MKKNLIVIPLLMLGSGAQAAAYGALGNFDTVNDTGQTCYGFEIEIDDIKSTDIGGTFSYNHYGTPAIREDDTVPGHPKVYVRYAAPTPSGVISGYTNSATPGSIAPTMGHQCTNPAINLGCEHFGVGIYTSSYTAVKYNWLVKDSSGNLVTGPAVNVNTPVYTYTPPVIAHPAQIIPNPVVNLPPIVQVPAVVAFGGNANVVANIPAPAVANNLVQNKEFGDPSWVKAIKTTTHKSNPALVLDDLVGDADANGNPKWANGETAEVETEWYLLQTDNGSTNLAKANLAGSAEDMGDGSELVTRRYEFYAYGAPVASVDDQTGEAMCDTVATDGIHGVGSVGVTKNNPAIPGETMTVSYDCSTASVVGDYLGAQMNSFDPNPPFATISDIQSGVTGSAFPQRKVLIGGSTPYATTVSGALPNGLSLDSASGVISGTPGKVGAFAFTVSATDSFGSMVSTAYTLNVTGKADVNVDYQVDVQDLALIQGKYGQPAVAGDPADVNGDLKVNLLDYRQAARLCSKAKCAH